MLGVLCADLTSFHPMQVIIRANPFSLFHESHRHDHVLFWPPWNNLHLRPDEVNLNVASHRAQVSYGRVLMFFQSKIRVDADSTEQVSLAYVEEYWEYAKNRHCSMVGSGNMQMYAPGVYYVIPLDRILCKAHILPDPATPTIPAGALPRIAARRRGEYPHAKEDGVNCKGSKLYIYDFWSMHWGLHPGLPPQ